MHWDDLALLKTIDELEHSEPGSLMNGLSLMQRAANGVQLDFNRDYRSFTWELLVAHHADLVIYEEHAVYPPNVDPLSNPNSWLQQIQNIRLTIPGRDRAKGRVVLKELPDPDEDDDRLITGMTLEEIARAVAEPLTPSQLPRFLVDSGIPEEALPPTVDGKWEYVMTVLEQLHESGSAARRLLREFIGLWLEDQLDIGQRPDVRRRILSLLARSGWTIKEGRLVIGQRHVGDNVPDASPVGREARIAALNPAIRQVADRYLDSGHPEVAIFEAFKAVTTRVKEMTGMAAEGADLMNKAFGGDSPQIVLADVSTAVGKDIQNGLRFMFMGAVRAIRNPDAHEQFKPVDDGEALELLTFASLLMRRLDRTPRRADG